MTDGAKGAINNYSGRELLGCPIHPIMRVFGHAVMVVIMVT